MVKSYSPKSAWHSTVGRSYKQRRSWSSKSWRIWPLLRSASAVLSGWSFSIRRNADPCTLFTALGSSCIIFSGLLACPCLRWVREVGRQSSGNLRKRIWLGCQVRRSKWMLSFPWQQTLPRNRSFCWPKGSLCLFKRSRIALISRNDRWWRIKTRRSLALRPGRFLSIWWEESSAIVQLQTIQA